MLPSHMKLHRPEEFRAVMRSRKKKGSATVVVHYLSPGTGLPGSSAVRVTTPSPRFGLVVGKNVGNAVTRHRVSRRLRHILFSLAPAIEPGSDVVVRALPAAASASGKELDNDVRTALGRLTGQRL
ncbi:ribonuclease P protein component [Corynebacterium mendelii]|uniref:Ribonuclease P protein component n=1 Tax=Corynebacterium mendelii TaxID=2765362 RepID=A0A939E0Q6_9CORY|nr:ribonuclease P protein component [Corynebacterium mendelii]MBN9644306.1 ribonuclease P protein component [Corynebacterium mendelii]